MSTSLHHPCYDIKDYYSGICYVNHFCVFLFAVFGFMFTKACFHCFLIFELLMYYIQVFIFVLYSYYLATMDVDEFMICVDAYMPLLFSWATVSSFFTAILSQSLLPHFLMIAMFLGLLDYSA